MKAAEISEMKVESAVGAYDANRIFKAIGFALVLHAVVLIPAMLFAHAKPATAATPSKTNATAAETPKADIKKAEGQVAERKPLPNPPNVELKPMEPKHNPTNVPAAKANEIPNLPSPHGLDDSTLK